MKHFMHHYRVRSNICIRNRLPKNIAFSRIKPIRAIGIVEQSEIIGKGITFFVLFTATLNWMYYRRLRKKIEDEQKK